MGRWARPVRSPSTARRAAPAGCFPPIPKARWWSWTAQPTRWRGASRSLRGPRTRGCGASRNNAAAERKNAERRLRRAAFFITARSGAAGGLRCLRLGLGDLGLFDQDGIGVSGAEILVDRYLAGDHDFIADVRRLLAGDGDVVGALFAGAILDVEEVAVHHAVVHLHHLAAHLHFVAAEFRLVLIKTFHGLLFCGLRERRAGTETDEARYTANQFPFLGLPRSIKCHFLLVCPPLNWARRRATARACSSSPRLITMQAWMIGPTRPRCHSVSRHSSKLNLSGTSPVCCRSTPISPRNSLPRKPRSPPPWSCSTQARPCPTSPVTAKKCPAT